ncbi:hypothetical protein Tco_0434340 [Tanacetum coccineum]
MQHGTTTGLYLLQTKRGGFIISKQCTMPKRKRDEKWFNDKVLLVQAQASGQVLTEEEIAFLADPGLPDTQTSQTVITHNAAYQADDLDAYDSNFSDSNIIPYSQYLSETQQETVQNSNSSAHQDFSGSNEQYAEIEGLKETLSKQVQEKDSLMKTFGVKAQKLYDGMSILKMDAIVIHDSDETLMLCEERFVKEKETTATAITEGTWGFEHTKACFRYEIIPFIKDLKDIFNKFNHYLVDELADVQNSVKTVAENEHFETDYKQLYDSIKPKRVQSKEQCDALIKQVNIKSGEISDLNAKLQEQGLVIAALKNELRKLKGKALDKEAIETHSVDPKVSKDNVEPITPKFLPLGILSINNFDPQLVAVTPRKKDKKVRFAESLTSTENTKTDSTSNIVSNKRVLHSTGNSKKHDNSDYVCINDDDCMSSDNLCVSNSMNDVKFRAKPKKKKSKEEIWKPTGKVFTKMGYIWRPTGQTFTIVGNACPLTRITTTNEVPSRKPIVLESKSPKPVVNLVYSRKPRKNKNTESVSKTEVIKTISANKQEPSKSWGSTKTNVPSTSLNECRLSKSSSGIWTPTLREYYEKVDISHETSVARSPQQNVTSEAGTLVNSFIGYAPTKKAFRIYNRHTRRIIETIHVDFDELTAMASEPSSSGPALHDMTHVTISSGLVPNPPPSTPFVPPSRSEWDLLFQPMFDKSLNPPPYVDLQAPEVIAPIPEVVSPEHVVLTGSPSSTTVDQDAPSPIAHMGNDPYFGIPIPEVTSDQSSSSDVIHTIVPPDHQVSAHNSKWTKGHPLENIIVEPKNYNDRINLQSNVGLKLCKRNFMNLNVLKFGNLFLLLIKHLSSLLKFGFDSCDQWIYFMVERNPNWMRFKKGKRRSVTLSWYGFGTSFILQPISLLKGHVENGVIKLYFVNKKYQLADIFTKLLAETRIISNQQAGLRSLYSEDIEKVGQIALRIVGKDIKVKKSKNKQKPTRNEETSDQEERYQSQISPTQGKSQIKSKEVKVKKVKSKLKRNDHYTL